jgi:predicted amidohydrolase
MQRTIQIATVQMDVCPAPTEERLYRADMLISDAVQAGAELVVLPELFNTGYAYSPDNFARAEPPNGPTATWMKRAARQQHVHLAGSLLQMEDGEIYNAMLIAAPNGKTWCYDKCYPWAWEHGYFRGSRRQGTERAVIAHTDLGDIGMLICWDAAHPELWMAYAGQVDLMVICSSPPHFTNATFTFPNGERVTAGQMGLAWKQIKHDDVRVFGEMLDEQAAWLQVPAASSAACGQFTTVVPRSRLIFLSMLPTAPGLARYLPQADNVTLSASMINANKILNPQGKPLTRGTNSHGETFITAEVQLADRKPQPQGPQPAAKISKLSYFLSDNYFRSLMQPVYRAGIRPVK